MGPFAHKLPVHGRRFTYSRIPQIGGGVVYRLFRRDQRHVLHAEQRVYSPACARGYIARELNIARHQLRNTVDEIDLALMGVTQ